MQTKQKYFKKKFGFIIDSGGKSLDFTCSYANIG